jgi:hypothetical protein
MTDTDEDVTILAAASPAVLAVPMLDPTDLPQVLPVPGVIPAQVLQVLGRAGVPGRGARPGQR